MKIGFVGLGNMGLPMATRLAEAGHEVYGKNRSPGKERAFAAVGGKSGLSLIELVERMDVVLTCLPLPADVAGVYEGEGGLLSAAHPRAALVDCSTVAPELSRRLFERAKERNIGFLDAPVSGGTAGAAAGTLSVMVGGERELFERIKDVFAPIGKQIYYVGAAGSGSAVKLINQLMVGIHSQAVAEAFALGAANGLEADLLFEILHNSFAQSRIMERHYKNYIAKDRFEAGFAIKLLAKDMNLVSELGEASGVRLAAGNRAKALIARAAAGACGNDDMAGLYRVQRDGDAERAAAGALKHYAVLLPMRDVELSARYRADHLRFLDERRAAGALLANGRLVDGTGGLVIYRAASYEEVEAQVQQDPYIVQGARTYEIHEWDVVLADG